MRAILISLLAAALIVTGCAIQPSPQAQSAQAGSNSSPGRVEGLCKSPDVPPADVAHIPGYRQFDVSVTNSTGWPVAGLTQRDFVLYAGTQTFPVAYFREHKNDEPVAIALVVETSGSMASRLSTVKQSLRDFVENLNPCDEVTVFAFNSQVSLIQPFSTDHQMTAERMELFNVYGKSALYDATNAAVQSLEGADYHNRKLILIADGIDTSSVVTEQAVVARATKDGVPIYAIGIGNPNAPKKLGIAWGQPYAPSAPPIVVGPPNIGTRTLDMPPIQRARPGPDRVEVRSLEDLSVMAGGRSFIVPSSGEVAGNSFETAIFAVADNLAKGYTIGTVVPADVTLSTVKVTVAKKLDLDVRARPIAAAP
jgi:VWFA-related protein